MVVLWVMSALGLFVVAPLVVALASYVIRPARECARYADDILVHDAPGGHLILTCPTGTVYETEKHFGHVRHPHLEQLRTWLRDAGLVVRDLRQWGFPFYSLTKWATNVRADFALKHFSEKPYGVAQRAIAGALYAANFLNASDAPGGVQLFALAEKPQAAARTT